MSTVRIVRGRVEARVFSPFAAKETIKTMPTRRWDKTAKCWVIPNTDVPLLQAFLQRDRFTVWIVDQPGNTEGQEPSHRSPQGTWAERMFAELDPPLAEKAFNALIRVLHPDAGGSTAAMQALNSARDKAEVAR